MDKLKIAILRDRLNRVEQSRYSDPDLQGPIWNHIVNAAQALLSASEARSVTLAQIANRAVTSSTYVLQRFVDIERFLAAYIQRSIALDEREWAEIEKKHPGNPQEQLYTWTDEVAARLASNSDAPLPLPIEAAILLYDTHSAREIIKQRKAALRAKLAQIADDPLCYRDPAGLADKLMMLAEGAVVMRAIFTGDEVAERFFEAAHDLFKRHAEP